MDELIQKFIGYLSEYEKEGKVDLARDLSAIIDFLKKDDVESAFKIMIDSPTKYDLTNSYQTLMRMKDEKKLETRGLTNWGKVPGKHIAYRAGVVSRAAKNGIYFAPHKEEAEAYSDTGSSSREVHKYEVTIRNPLVVKRGEDAISILGGKVVDVNRAKNVGDAWIKNDKRMMTLLQKSEYDSICFTNPAPPATRELIIPSSGVGSIKLMESQGMRANHLLRLSHTLLMEADPSLQPPKRWFGKMKKRIKKGNPSYTDDQVSAAIGSIWYKRLSDAKRKEIRAREGKKYGPAS